MIPRLTDHPPRVRDPQAGRWAQWRRNGMFSGPQVGLGGARQRHGLIWSAVASPLASEAFRDLALDA
jgi:hypothetical protein